MKDTKVLSGTAYSFEGKMPLRQAIPLGLQHVLAMFVGNLTPLLIITGACGLGVGSEFADLQVSLLQNAMLVAGLVTLLQLFAIGPVGGKVPIIMGTSSGKFFFDSCRDIERYGSYRICSYIFIGEHCHITSIDYLFVGCCAGYAVIWSMDSSVIGPKFSSSVCSDRRVSYAKEIRVIRFIIAEYCNIKI